MEGALPAWKELYHLAQSAKEGALPSRGTVAAKSSSTQRVHLILLRACPQESLPPVPQKKKCCTNVALARASSSASSTKSYRITWA